MAIKFANLASTTLASGITSTATTLTVGSAANFPTLSSGDYFYGSLGVGSGSEIVKVTAISGSDFTITRGQDGTTAQAWDSGTAFALRVVAAALDDLATAADTESVSIAGDTMTGALTLDTGTNGLPTINLSHSNSGADNFRIQGGIPGTSNGGFSIRDVDAGVNRFTIDSSGAATFANTISSGAITAPTVRLTDTDDLSLSSTAHAFQVGPSSGVNIAMDNNEIMARNNGSASSLHLNAEGGNVTFNNVQSGSVSLYMSGSRFMDSNRNLENLGTISSGAITASADSTITTSGFTRLYINSTRTSGNIGGVDFQASGTIKGQIYGTVDGQIKIATNGSTVAATFDASQNATFAGAITTSGNIQQNYGNELRGKDSGGTNRTLLRTNSNKLQIGWSYPGDVEFMGGGSYTKRMAISGSTGDVSIVNDLSVSGSISASEQSVFTGNAISGTPNSNAQLVVADSGVAGIAIHSNDGGQSYIWFGDNTNNAVGRIYYSHSVDKVFWRVGGNNDVHTLDSSGNATFAGSIAATGRSTFDSVTIDDDGSGSPILRVVADDLNPWAFQIENDSATNDGLFQAYVNNNNNLYFRAKATGAYPTWYLQVSNGTTVVDALSLTSGGVNASGYINGATYRVGGTEVFDSSRNLTNIGTITFGDSHTIGNDADDNLEIASSSSENVIVKSADGIYLRTGGNTNALTVRSDQKIVIGDTGSHTDDLLQIETPASGGGHGIQIRRNDANGDQTLGTITWGNNTAVNLAKIRVKTDGDSNAGDSGAIIFQTRASGSTLESHLTLSSNKNSTFAGNVQLNSRLTFGYNSHYFEAGTNSVTFKNSSGTAYATINNSGITSSGAITSSGNIVNDIGSSGNDSFIELKNTGYTGNVTSLRQNADSSRSELNATERPIYIQAGSGGGATGAEIRLYANQQLGYKLNASKESTFYGNASFTKGTRSLDLTLADSPATGDVGVQFRAGSGDYIGLAGGGSGTGIGLVVDSSNNIGVGTDSPYSGTNVRSITINAPSYPVLALRAGDSNYAIINAVSSYLNVGTIGSRYITFTPNDSEKMRLSVGGTLHLNNYTASNAKLRAQQTTNSEWVANFINYTGSAYGVSIDTSSATTSSTFNFAAYTPSGTGFFLNNYGVASLGTTMYDSTNTGLQLMGRGIAIKNDRDGSNNNWSRIQNRATGSASNLYFGLGSGNIEFTHGGTIVTNPVANYHHNFNDNQADSDFRVASTSKTHALWVNAGDNYVNVGNAVGRQTIANLNVRENGAAIEFGHQNNTSGYYGTLGAYGNNGMPYIGFSTYSEASANTFTTNGFAGNIIVSDQGTLQFNQVTNSSATGQTPVRRMTLTTSGRLTLHNETAPSNHAALNIGYVGGETRAIDIDGSWSSGESKSISFTHGSTTANLVGQMRMTYNIANGVQNNSSGSVFQIGRFYHGGDSTAFPVNIYSQSTVEATVHVQALPTGTTAANGGFQVSRTGYGAIHAIGNQSGTNGSADTIGMVTIAGNNGADVQGGIYASQNSSTGTSIAIFTTNNYGTGPQQTLSVLDGGNVIVNRGRLGVGTSSPSTTLEINDTLPQIRLEETGSGGSKRLDMSVNSDGVAIIGANQSAQEMRLMTTGSNRLVVKSNGRIGIGEDFTSPLMPLELREGVSGDWISRFYNTNSNGLGFLVRTDATAANNQVAFGVYTDSQYLISARSNGRVGIRQTAPSEVLTVGGVIAASTSSYTVNATTANFGFYNGGGTPVTYVQMPANGRFELWKPNTGAYFLADSGGRIGIQKGPVSTVSLSIAAQATSNSSYGLEVTNATSNTRFLVDGTGNSYFYKTDNAVGMRWDASNSRLGVNVSSPSMTLDVRGNARIGDGVSGEQDIFFSAGSGSWQVGTNASGNGTSNNQFYIYDSAYRFTVQKGTGYTGIGTNSPGALLHVQSNDSTTNATVGLLRLTTLSTGTTTVGFGPEIRFQAERNDGTMQNTGAIASVAEINSGTNISSGLAFNTGTVGVLSEKMRLNYLGYLGLGRNTAYYGLDLKAPGNNLARLLSSSGDALVRIIANNYATESDARLFLGEADTYGMTFEYDGVANIGYIGMNDNVDPTGSYSRRITFPRTNTTTSFMAGNVGIGNDNPSSPLTVQADSGAGVARFIGRSSDNISSLGFYNNAQNSDIYIQSNGDWFRARADSGFHFRRGGTPAATDTDGFTINGLNVGINNDNPQHKLDIWEAYNDVTMRLHRVSSGLASTDCVGIGFSQRSDTNVPTSDTRAGIFSTYNGNLFLATEPGGDLNSNPGDHSALMITGTSQNIGIGNVSPSSKLHITTSGGSTTAPNVVLTVQADTSSTITTGGGTAIKFKGVSSGGNIQNYDQAMIASLGQATNNGHGLDFYVKPNASTALTKAVTITSGKVLNAVGGYQQNGTTVIDSSSRHLASDGSQSAPSYLFSSDTDTGFFRAGSGQVSVTANNHHAMSFRNYGLDMTMNASGYVDLHRSAGITFYGDESAHHSIRSRDMAGYTSADLRINSYRGVFFNLDSNNNDTSGANLIVGRHGGTNNTISGLFKVDGENGNVTAEGTITASTTVSDIRRKENVEIIPDALEKVKQLDGITFNFIGDDTPMTGLIAQQVQEVLPSAVYETELLNGEKTLALHYGNTVGLLVESIKTLEAQVSALTKTIEEMQNGSNKDK